MTFDIKSLFFGRKPEGLRDSVIVEMKLPNGSNQDQKKGNKSFDYPSTSAMLDYSTMAHEGYTERWFGYLAVKRGNTRSGNNEGGQAYLVCYAQQGVADAARRLAAHEKLPAYRVGGHGQIIMGVTDPVKIRQTLRGENLRVEIPIPGCKTQTDVEALCLKLAMEAKFEERAKGWELLAGCLLQTMFPYVKHIGSNTDRDGDLYQKGDLLIGRR